MDLKCSLEFVRARIGCQVKEPAVLELECLDLVYSHVGLVLGALPVGDSVPDVFSRNIFGTTGGRGGLLVDEAGDGLICLGVLVACHLHTILDRGQEKVSDSLEWGYRQQLTAM